MRTPLVTTHSFGAFKASDLGEPCGARIPPIRIETLPVWRRSDVRVGGERDFRKVDLSWFEVFGVRIKTDVGWRRKLIIADLPGRRDIRNRSSREELASPSHSMISPLPAVLNQSWPQFTVEGLDEDVLEDVGEFEIRFFAARPTARRPSPLSALLRPRMVRVLFRESEAAHSAA